ncbi:hypothetical protein BDZ94DRAFT_1257563 [Collybia nuda]|uniref:SH3 domain-containing protein n=1 Tax=Collybia nuda TaxID=64659 RepID=A0A9P6CJ07_9AGAR|nr:hypothetical protein BDZ94DRAFT_1257563 [Collybia nuda]
MNPAALLAHIVSQTRQNVEFLISQNQISVDNGRDILAKLPSPSPSSSDAYIEPLIQRTQNITLQSPPTSTTTTVVTSPVPNPTLNLAHTTQSTESPPPAGPAVLFQAKAMWNYNEQGQNSGDLSFIAGEMIDVIAETNADWWTGSHKGKQGLFPSNYVERTPLVSVLPSPAPTPYSEKVQGAGFAHSSYQPTGGYQGPPPPSQSGYAPYGPGVSTQPIQPTTAPEAPKKSKFGSGLKNTLAHSAVGGVGFGAGSAVGSGLINSIF